MNYNFSSKETASISYSSQANNSVNDQSDGTGDLTNGNFTVNHLQLASFALNSVFNDTTVNSATFGFQYWNNLIASNISAPLVTFPNASFGTNTNVPQQSFQRKWQFKDDFSKSMGKHTFKGGVDYIWNPVEGGFFEFSSTLEIDFGANPTDIISNKGGAYPNSFATPGAVVSMAQANGDPYLYRCNQAAWLLRAGRLESEPAPDPEPGPALGQGLQHDRRVGYRGQPHLSRVEGT